MTDTTRRQEIRTIGLYLLIILALARFLVYPLHNAVAWKKEGLQEQCETYRLKSRLLERREAKPAGRAPALDRTALSPRVYEKEVGYFDIQAHIVDRIGKFAEKKGLIMTNLEFPEPIPGKNVSEVPVILKLQGKMLDFIETLEIIEKNPRLFIVKGVDISRIGNDFGYSLTITALRVEK